MLTHDELAADLAAKLRTDRRMVWTDIQLGPSGSPRPDVYAIFKSFSHHRQPVRWAFIPASAAPIPRVSHARGTPARHQQPG